MADETSKPIEPTNKASTLTEAAGKEQPDSAQHESRLKRIVRVVGRVAPILIISLAVLIILGLFLRWLIYNPSITAAIRDIMIIFLAFTMLLTSLMLVVLVYQLARLTRSLRDEIKPLLESAQETMNTLRGTTAFMSENLVEPTIKASSTIAGIQRIIELLLDMHPGAKPKT